MTDNLLLQHTENGVLRLTLNSPGSRNSLSCAMLSALQNAFDAASTNPEVRVIVLAANGPVFCAGHDLKEMTAARANEDKGRAFFESTLAQCAALMQSLTRQPQPVIAEVHALATAAGCQLAASADLVVAARSAHFATPGVHIGLFCSTPMVALSRAVGHKHAMEMLLLGDPVDADTAWRMGLVNRVVPDAELTATANTLAANIAAKSTLTVKTGKQAYYTQAERDLESAYDYASRVMTENMLAFDAEEGINAFIEKRDPEWQDR